MCRLNIFICQFITTYKSSPYFRGRVCVSWNSKAVGFIGNSWNDIIDNIHMPICGYCHCLPIYIDILALFKNITVTVCEVKCNFWFFSISLNVQISTVWSLAGLWICILIYSQYSLSSTILYHIKIKQEYYTSMGNNENFNSTLEICVELRP